MLGGYFTVLDLGVLSCFNAMTGAILYSERLGNGNEGFTSSPVSDGRNLFFAGETGHVYVVPASTKFSVLATNKLEAICMATPALSQGTLYYRTKDQVLALGQR